MCIRDSAYVPEASCLTNVPTKFAALTKQRRRWEWATITFECRKHVDAANPFNKHFNIRDFFMFLERWTFNFVLVYFNVIFCVYLLLFRELWLAACLFFLFT